MTDDGIGLCSDTVPVAEGVGDTSVPSGVGGGPFPESMVVLPGSAGLLVVDMRFGTRTSAIGGSKAPKELITHVLHAGSRFPKSLGMGIRGFIWAPLAGEAGFVHGLALLPPMS